MVLDIVMVRCIFMLRRIVMLVARHMFRKYDVRVIRTTKLEAHLEFS